MNLISLKFTFKSTTRNLIHVLTRFMYFNEKGSFRI